MRTLGSFNERLNLASHRDDHAPVADSRPAIRTLQTDGYTLGVALNDPPGRRYGPTGGDFGQSKQTPGRQRMAGQALNLKVTKGTGLPSTPTDSMMGSAELRTPNIAQ